jgi:hypothetical protein
VGEALNLFPDGRRRPTEGQFHPTGTAQGVDEEGNAGAPDVLKEERGPLGLDGPEGDLGDLEAGVDGRGDAAELAVGFQTANERGEVVEGGESHYLWMSTTVQ